MRLNYLTSSMTIGLVVSVVACVEPYPAPDIADDLSILVVDGSIDASNGIATVRLTHTTKLTEEAGSPAEKGALVSVRTESGDSYILAELDSGRYIAEGMPIDPLQRYQLYIRVQGGEEYISDYVTLKKTPPIDSVTWRPDGDGVSIMANTHDENGQSKYYRWDYSETWEYHSPYVALFKVIDNQVIYRDQDEFVYKCYRTLPSTRILTTSTVHLSEDMVRDFQLTYIPRVSSKLSVLYSILVKQRVVDEKEFEFWQDLQRVTEGLGGLFDSQPYEIVGNVHQLDDASTPVLGYFSAGFVAEQRVFLSFYDLPPHLQVRPYHGCVADTVCVVIRPPLRCTIDVPNLPPNPLLLNPLMEGPSIWGYSMGTTSCADCRTQGGTLTKPDFFP
jgi:hypothetical protein